MRRFGTRQRQRPFALSFLLKTAPRPAGRATAACAPGTGSASTLGRAWWQAFGFRQKLGAFDVVYWHGALCTPAIDGGAIDSGAIDLL
jgi:hypothetical protein